MSTARRIAYVGPALSGRTTSVDVLTTANGASLTRSRDRSGPHRLRFDDRDYVITVSFVRAHYFYEHALKSGVANKLAPEIDQLAVADGIVFVADAQAARMGGNLDERDKPRRDLDGRGVCLDQVPVVFQVNKVDLPTALRTSAMEASIRSANCRYVESVATRALGVLEAFRALNELIAP